MHFNGVYVDSYALCSSLTSLSCVKNVCIGKMMHAHVQKSGWLSSVFVGSALVDFYAKMCVNDAAMVFDEMPSKNTVCINALLSGYAEAKIWDEVIQLIRRIEGLNFDVDNFTMTAALRACAGLCEVELGRQIHATVLRKFDLGADVFLQSLLIEMYGKCGLVERARQVFDMVGFRVNGERKGDVVLWTSMLGIYGRNGNYVEVIRLFGNMLKEGIRPDGVAFLTVISACSHTGQVEVGMEYFESMSLYGLFPSSEHYSCLVDLLCRAGELEKAWELIAEMPHSEEGNCTISMWGTLLSACNEHGNVDLGKLAAQRALELEPQNVGIYVLLSNMFARNGMWDEIGQLRELMKMRGLKKDIGWSSIGVAN